MNSASVPAAGRPVAAALAAAAELAARAPSIHNTRPWRWRIGVDSLDLFTDVSRSPPATDPVGMMLTISCGAALHHARVALAAAGVATRTEPLPDPAIPEHLARLMITSHQSASTEAIGLARAIETRQTDRRANVSVPVTAQQVETLRQVAEDEGVHLHRLAGDQLTELVLAVYRAEAAADQAPPATASGTGFRPPGLPSPQSEDGERDFGSVSTLRVGGEHDRASTYVVLCGDTDDRAAWLRAGQALSAVWLDATRLKLALLPYSQVVEIGATREQLRRLMSGLDHPYLVVRLGIADPDTSTPSRAPVPSGARTTGVSEDSP
jgi:hypothetical protein